MTELEKELKPIQNWVEEKLKGRKPYNKEIDTFFCAALIKQYHKEQLALCSVGKQREQLGCNVKNCYRKGNKHKDGYVYCDRHKPRA